MHSADAPPRRVAGAAHVLVAEVRSEPARPDGGVPEDPAGAPAGVAGVNADADAPALDVDQAEQLGLEVAGAEQPGGEHRRRPRLELQQVQQQGERGDHPTSSSPSSPSAMQAR